MRAARALPGLARLAACAATPAQDSTRAQACKVEGTMMSSAFEPGNGRRLKQGLLASPRLGANHIASKLGLKDQLAVAHELSWQLRGLLRRR